MLAVLGTKFNLAQRLDCRSMLHCHNWTCPFTHGTSYCHWVASAYVWKL